ncbi:MAG: ankyrin repeat domain-containing protein [Acidobacteria bacterium]|nr:ankyrin repeat domain-containing protein [Acidobacteriota bacterium]
MTPAPNAENEDTLQEFFDAIRADDVFLLTQMLNQDPALRNAKAPNGVPAVMMAVYHHRPDVINLLARSGANVDACTAAAMGDVARLSAALADDKDALARQSADGWTPLHLAAFFAKKDAVEYLLQAGAPVTVRSGNQLNNHPLHAAAAGKSPEVVALLLTYGADPNATQAGGWTPLHAAAQNADAEMVKALLTSGATIEVRAENGQSPLDLAMGVGSQEVVDLLMTSE